MKKRYETGKLILITVLCISFLSGCDVFNDYFVESGRLPLGEVQESQPEIEEVQEEPQIIQEEPQLILEEEMAQREIQSISVGNYAYECLSEEEKLVYDQMLTAILEFQEDVELSTLDEELMQRVYQALTCDYGSLFWMDGYVYTKYTKGGELVGLEFSPTYTMDQTQKEQMQSQVDEVADQWLGGISILDSDYDKAKYVFETLVEHVDYVENAQDNQNILSVFLYQQTVCQGYASATQYLLRQLGIPCMIVSGYANNQAHAWNIVCLDGEYYHMDTTWGNSSYLDTDKTEAKFVNYNYLCMTDLENSYTHQMDMPFPLPVCNSMENNYYVREGRYFESWDPEEIGAVFQQAWVNEEDSVTIKCADIDIYKQMRKYFIQEQRIADYCFGMTEIRYMEEPLLQVFTLNFH